MIVRISGTGQFTVSEETLTRLNEIDNATVEAVEAGDEARFRELFGQLHSVVRDEGTPLADDELSGSDIFIPHVDLTLEEAQEEFTGEGLIPG